MQVSLIAALSENGVIGHDNQLPWHIPQDLAHFKALTLGKPVIMGRRTHESIGRVLPGRLNVVLSRAPGYQPAGIRVADSVPAALAAAEEEGATEAMIIGGAQIYRLFLPLASRLYLTQVHRVVDGDAFFPPIAPADWLEVSRRDITAAGAIPTHSYLILDRRQA